MRGEQEGAPLSPASSPPYEERIEERSLTLRERRCVREVHDAYADFWHALQFRRGWAKPPFSLEDVDDLLWKAADYCVRIRSHLDEANDGTIKMRVVDGSAREWLWTVNYDPRKEPVRFIRGLVHATFMDSRGYVEGLSEEEVDDYMDDINKYFSRLRKGSEDYDWVAHLRELYHQIGYAMATLKRPTDHEQAAGAAERARQLAAQLEEIRNKLVSELGADEPHSWHDPAVLGPHDVTGERHAMDVEPSAPPAKPAEGNKRGPAMQAPTSTVEEVAAEEEHEHAAPASGPGPRHEGKRKHRRRRVHREAAAAAEAEGGSAEAAAADETRAPEPAAQEEADDSAELEIKKVVDDVGDFEQNVMELLVSSNTLDASDLSADPDHGLARVEELQHKCEMYTEKLLQDLMKLDAINTTPETRPLRKEQVQHVQTLIDNVDHIRARLKALRSDLKQATQPSPAPSGAAEAPAPGAEAAAPAGEAAQRMAAGAASDESDLERHEHRIAAAMGDEGLLDAARRVSEAAADQSKAAGGDEEQARRTKLLSRKIPASDVDALAELLRPQWKQLRLDPNIRVAEQARAYELSAYLPGMRREDIDVGLSASDSVLTVAGYREPSRDELQAMIEHLPLPIALKAPVAGLTRMGAGRFGRFKTQYRVPPDADVAGISAAYERGVLRVTIPKVRRERPREPPEDFPELGTERELPGWMRAGPSRRGLSFFDDKDLWW